MNITYEIIGELLQILGVAIVLYSQVKFGYKTWREYGSLRKAFFAMISSIRIGGGRTPKELKKLHEKYFEETFPEWWKFSKYLSTDIRDSAIGLVVTLIGLIIALFEGNIQLPVLQFLIR